MKNKTFIIILFFLFLFSFCDRNRQDNFLKIESRWFTTDEFFSFTPRYTFKYLPEAEKNKKIEEFIDRQLMVYKAIDDGYLKDPDIKKKIELIRNRLLINEYFDQTVLDSVVTKRRLLTEYEILNPDKKELFTFDEYKPVLKKRLVNKFSKDIQTRYFEIIESIKSEHEFELNSANITALSKVYMDSLISHRNDTLSHTAIDILELSGFELSLYRIRKKDFFLKDFIPLIRFFPFALPDQFSDPQLLSNVIETVVINNLVLEKSLKLKLYHSEDFKQRMNNQRNTMLYKKVFSNEITSKIKINDDTLRQFYSTNLDSLYLTRKKYEVQEIFIKDKELAESILDKVLNDEDFQQLADKYTERYQNKPKKGYLGFIYSDSYASIGRSAAKTEAGHIYPELIPSGKGFSIIKVLSVSEPKPIPFEDIKSRVLNDYKKHGIEKRKQELIQSLRHKYTYYVDYSKLTN